MPSPKIGTAKSPVPPGDPEDAFEADDAKPGEVEAIKAEQRQQGAGKYGETQVKPHKPDNKKKSWIEIKLVDEANQPVPGERYRITLPDGGTIAEGTLDERGFARIDGIDQGLCRVTFPDLDKDAWQEN